MRKPKINLLICNLFNFVSLKIYMKTKQYIPKLGLFFLIFIIPGVESCKDNNKDYVPYVPVNLVLDLQTDLSYLGVGETAIITPNEYGFGVLHFASPKYPEITLGQEVYGNGLIVYRFDINEFVTYDITCTFNATTDYCALDMDDTWLIPKCPCCQSEFNILLEASPVSGPAALPLKAYTTFIRNNQLYIKN
ncbi:MAG: hypothetical protein AMS27_00560 [Bacteroides sp. SM23_62_1]|nr:MAG: hypothetical protein AMS27_00560 [Bacteroides sp. SM23_62_1]